MEFLVRGGVMQKLCRGGGCLSEYFRGADRDNLKMRSTFNLGAILSEPCEGPALCKV